MAGVANDILIRTESLWKTYEMGSTQVHALRDVSFKIHRNEYVAIMGPVRFRKVYADEPDRLPRYADTGSVLAERETGQRNERR
jgi:hypothetical protein